MHNPKYAPKYAALITRLDPTHYGGVPVAGYLTNITLTDITSLTDIISMVGSNFGGGRFQIRYVDIENPHHTITDRTFVISGAPLINQIPCNCPTKQLMARGCNSPLHI